MFLQDWGLLEVETLAPTGSFELFEPTGLTGSLQSDWSVLNVMDRMFIQLPFESFPDIPSCVSGNKIENKKNKCFTRCLCSEHSLGTAWGGGGSWNKEEKDVKRIWQVSTSLKKDITVPFICYLPFVLVCFFLFLFPFTSKRCCILHHDAKSGLCQSWQFEHTLFKVGLKQRSEFSCRGTNNVTQCCQTPVSEVFAALRGFYERERIVLLIVCTSIHRVFVTPCQLEVFFFVNNHFGRRCSPQNTELIKHEITCLVRARAEAFADFLPPDTCWQGFAFSLRLQNLFIKNNGLCSQP